MNFNAAPKISAGSGKDAAGTCGVSSDKYTVQAHEVGNGTAMMAKAMSLAQERNIPIEDFHKKLVELNPNVSLRDLKAGQEIHLPAARCLPREPEPPQKKLVPVEKQNAARAGARDAEKLIASRISQPTAAPGGARPTFSAEVYVGSRLMGANDAAATQAATAGTAEAALKALRPLALKRHAEQEAERNLPTLTDDGQLASLLRQAGFDPSLPGGLKGAVGRFARSQMQEGVWPAGLLANVEGHATRGAVLRLTDWLGGGAVPSR